MNWIKKLNPGNSVLAFDKKKTKTYSCKVIRFYGKSKILVELEPNHRVVFDVESGQNIVPFKNDKILGSIYLMKIDRYG